MNKPIVYLSGPIADCTPEEIHGWRNEWIAHWGQEFVRDPARRVWTGSDNWDHYRDIINTDLDDIDDSDIILTKYFKPSCGTPMENVHGHFQGKFIVTVVEDEEIYRHLSPWIIFHSTVVVRSFEEAKKEINRWWYEN
ncbi:MAG TPA: hypothetical protein VEP90_00080 [Methylomirabilota bacterium]|nr:hypothetical protein [Methylomirabilota bacterium]